MEFIAVELDDDSCGPLEFEIPADATDEEIAYIESLVPRLESGLLELLDPDTDEVVFSYRPELVPKPTINFVRAIKLVRAIAR